MKKWISISTTVLLLSFSMTGKADNASMTLGRTIDNHYNPILSVVPSSTTSISVSSASSFTLSYTVTNNESVSIQNITIDPTYGKPNDIPSGVLTTRVLNNGCTGTLAANGGSCTFNLYIQGAGQTGNVILMPKVCGSFQASCSAPVANNRIAVTINAPKSAIAYVTNFNNNTVSICRVNANSSLDACATSNGNGTFNGPIQIVLNSTETIAYVADFNNNNVSLCPLNDNGSFGTCTTSNGSGTFNSPSGITINSTGTILYVANFGNRTISICPLNSNGLLGTCTAATDPSFNAPQTITLNSTDSYAYIPELTNIVSICPVNTNGTLGACSTSDANGTLNQPQGISFNAVGSFAYIGNFGSSLVSICPVNSNGLFGTCSTSNGNSTFNFSASYSVGLFMSSVTNYGYIPNDGNNTISVCSINSDGSLGACSTSSGNGTFNAPSAITLRS